MTSIAEFGSFFVGGRSLTIEGREPHSISFTDTASMWYDPNGLYHIEQAYVQYFVPTQKKCPLPVVLLHGGGMTGVMWEQTPDGRPGWAQNLVHAGFTVNVVDNTERGRAGWVPFDDVWQGPPIIRNSEEAWSLFRIGAAEHFPARIPFPGQRFPVDRLDVLAMGQVPRWLSNNPKAVDTFVAVLERIGPCAVVSHSHGGFIALQAANARPDLVKKMVLVEPSGFLASGSFSSLRDTSFLFMYGDNLDATPLWRSLTRQAGEFRRELENIGASVQWLELPRHGVRGNSHMLMMDDNSDDIANDVCRWLLSE
jgi:pimeloyl-ACP methyl ester carboxylesterase